MAPVEQQNNHCFSCSVRGRRRKVRISPCMGARLLCLQRLLTGIYLSLQPLKKNAGVYSLIIIPHTINFRVDSSSSFWSFYYEEKLNKLEKCEQCYLQKNMSRTIKLLISGLIFIQYFKKRHSICPTLLISMSFIHCNSSSSSKKHIHCYISPILFSHKAHFKTACVVSDTILYQSDDIVHNKICSKIEHCMDFYLEGHL